MRKLALIAALGLASCGSDYVPCDNGGVPKKSTVGIDVCLNNHEVSLDEFDSHFFDVEQLLDYEKTPVDLIVEVVKAECEIREDGSKGCFFEEVGMKYNGYFLAPRLIKIHTSNGGWSLERSTYRFELNRYFKFQNGSGDWDCKEYGVPSPNCFDKFVR